MGLSGHHAIPVHGGVLVQLCSSMVQQRGHKARWHRCGLVHHGCGLAAVEICADGCVCMSQQDQVRDPRWGQREPAALGWGGIETATSTLLRPAVVGHCRQLSEQLG